MIKSDSIPESTQKKQNALILKTIIDIKIKLKMNIDIDM